MEDLLYARMIERELQASVLSGLAQFPAMGLLGPRQVGKTILAHSVARSSGKVVFLNLERPPGLAKIANPEIYLEMQCNAEYQDISLRLPVKRKRPGDLHHCTHR